MSTFKCHALFILALMFHHLSTFASKMSRKCQNAGYEAHQKHLAQEQVRAGSEF